MEQPLEPGRSGFGFSVCFTLNARPGIEGLGLGFNLDLESPSHLPYTAALEVLPSVLLKIGEEGGLGFWGGGAEQHRDGGQEKNQRKKSS